jgi:hypothetical protein
MDWRLNGRVFIDPNRAENVRNSRLGRRVAVLPSSSVLSAIGSNPQARVVGHSERVHMNEMPNRGMTATCSFRPAPEGPSDRQVTPCASISEWRDTGRRCTGDVHWQRGRMPIYEALGVPRGIDSGFADHLNAFGPITILAAISFPGHMSTRSLDGLPPCRGLTIALSRIQHPAFLASPFDRLN